MGIRCGIIMPSKKVAFVALIIIMLTGLSSMVEASTTTNNNVVISVNRKTVLYTNYAIAQDTITIMNGSTNSLIADFGSGIQILQISGPNLSYAYQFSTNPSRVLLVFSHEIVAGDKIDIKYIYSGFLNSGIAIFPFQASYSVVSVNDTGVFEYGLAGLGPSVIQVQTQTKVVNVTSGQILNFNGTTPPFVYAKATTNLKPSFQAYITKLIRQISVAKNQLLINDELTVVWSSYDAGNQLYLLLPNDVNTKSISISDLFGNLTSKFAPNIFPNYSALVVTTRYQMQQGSKYELHISYSVPISVTSLSQTGFYGMYISSMVIQMSGVIPKSDEWYTSAGSYYLTFTNIVPNSNVLNIPITIRRQSNLFTTGSYFVLVIGAVALASSYTYSKVKRKKKEQRISEGVVALLKETLSLLERTVESFDKLSKGEIKSNIISALLVALNEHEKKLSKGLTDALVRKEIEKSKIDKIISSYREAKSAFSDSSDLYIQFSKKKIKESVYLQVRTRYEKAYLKAIRELKEQISDLLS